MSLRSDLTLTGSIDRKPNAFAGSGVTIEHIPLEALVPYEFNRSGTTWYLALHEMEWEDGEMIVTDGQSHSRRNIRGTVTLLPPNCEAKGWSRLPAGRHSVTILNVETTQLEPELALVFEKTPPRPVIYERDAALVSTLQKLTTMIVDRDTDYLPLEHLAVVAAYEATKLLRTDRPSQRRALPPRQFQDAIAYMLANLRSDISLDDIARAVGLSRFHFTRAFAASAGVSPIAYLTEKRAARAAELLRTSDLPLDEVAKQSGLGNNVNLRRALNRYLGSSPARYRRSIG